MAERPHFSLLTFSQMPYDFVIFLMFVGFLLFLSYAQQRRLLLLRCAVANLSIFPFLNMIWIPQHTTH